MNLIDAIVELRATVSNIIEPLMFKNLFCSWALVSINAEQLGQEVFCCWTQLVLDFLGNVVVSSTNLIIELLVCCTSIRELTGKYREQKHTHCPNVGWWSAVLSLENDLRSHVGWRTAKDFDLLVIWDTSRESEVDDFHLFVIVQE